MKRIAIYGRTIPDDFKKSLEYFIDWLRVYKKEVYIHHNFFEYLHQAGFLSNLKVQSTFSGYSDLPSGLDAMFCIGGDGTFLEAVSLVRNNPVPLIGIHSGRLGFLASITVDDLAQSLQAFQNKDYEVETRSLLRLESGKFTFPGFDCALNEITVYKRDSSSMITIHAYINGILLNTYWADGLIIATPTGSTAYSMSVGGPILATDTKNFIITPIAPHNLTVRPIVVSDDSVIQLKVESRSGNCMVSLDHRSSVIESGIDLQISKADFQVPVIRMNNQNFFNTLRQKLMWGADKRN